jgi:predicted DNA-binding transcriptional regulator YafY
MDGTDGAHNSKPRRGVSKLARLLELIVLLHGGPSFSVEELSRTLGVSRRTLFRYLNVLSEASVPFYYDQLLKGYRIRRDFFIAPPRLTADEALALYQGFELALKNGSHPKAREFAIAWSKVESQLPVSLRIDPSAKRHEVGQAENRHGAGPFQMSDARVAPRSRSTVRR